MSICRRRPVTLRPRTEHRLEAYATLHYAVPRHSGCTAIASSMALRYRSTVRKTNVAWASSLCRARSSGVSRGSSVLLFYGSEGQSLHKLLLGKPAEHHNRSDCQQRSRRKLSEEQTFRTRIGGDKRGQRRRVSTRQVDTPECLVPGKDNQDQRGRGKSRQGHWPQKVPNLFPKGSPIDPTRFQNRCWNFAKVGVGHPNGNRKIHQRVDHDQTDHIVQEAALLEDEINRNQHADGGHHLG